MRLTISVLLSATVSLAVAHARTESTLTLHPYFRELMTLKVTAGGQSLTMLVDTGAGATALTPAAARAAGCEPRGRDVGFRMSGERVTFARCGEMRVESGGWSRALDVAVFDLHALLPPELPRLDGIVGLDFFRGATITIDWRARQIRVNAAGNGAQSLAARFATGENGRFLTALVPVHGAGADLWFLLDSGNISGTIVARSIVEDGLLRLDADGTAMLAVDRAEPFRVSPRQADLIIDGALGTDYLLRGPVRLDLRATSALR